MLIYDRDKMQEMVDLMRCLTSAAEGIEQALFEMNERNDRLDTEREEKKERKIANRSR